MGTLRRWTMASSITLRSAAAATSIRRCIKSFTSCTFCQVDSLLNHAPDVVNDWIEVRAVRRLKNLDVHWGDHDLLHNCTFGMHETANNTPQSVWVNTIWGKDV